MPRSPRRRKNNSPASHHHHRNLGRRSYDAHRRWLIDQHGPICAYCGLETAADLITLDHVYPRRGQKAYDRPDNLVLACTPCNAAKADTPFAAFIAQKRSRGVFLLHYGEHLSESVKELIRKASEREFLPPENGLRPSGIRFRPGRNGRR